MPELPEVETVRRGLEPAMVGATLTRVEQRRPDLRFPFPDRFSERLVGSTVTSVGRRAKYLLVDLSSGEYTVIAAGYPPVATVLRMAGGGRTERDLQLGHED